MTPGFFLRPLAVAALALLALPGLAGQPERTPGKTLILANGESMSSVDLAGEWVVTDLMDATLPEGPPVTLAFEAGEISGFSGCNRFNATVAIDGTKVSFGPLAMTRMACGQEAMAVEIAFIRAMQRINEAQIDADGVLSLMGFGLEMMRARRG